MLSLSTECMKVSSKITIILLTIIMTLIMYYFLHSTTDIQAGTGFEQCMPTYNNIAYFGADSYSQICKSDVMRNVPLV